MLNMKPSLFLLFILFCASAAQAMVFDNRYLPLLQKPRFDLDGTLSCFETDFVIATASDAYSSSDQDTSIPEIWGVLDLGEMSTAMQKAGYTSPLRPDWQGAKIWFRTPSKIQMQALTFFFHQRLRDWFYVGASWAFFRTNSRQNFIVNTSSGKTNLFLSVPDILELEQDRVAMFNTVGIDSGHTAQLGFGDVDFWIRFAHVWNYTLKFRSIDAGIRFGMLAPSGISQDPHRSPSIPNGGDGHWGIYTTFESLFELKEDIKAGVSLRFSKRFQNTRNRRMPVLTEPDIFGVLYGPAKVDPGVTIIFSPYFLLENLRQGLALGLQYTLRKHFQDLWCDARCDQTVLANLRQVQKNSEWASEYFSLYVLYDFGRVRALRDLAPVLTFRWDIPSHLFVSNRVAKAQQVSLGLEFAF
jgi:hypothetical protein